MARKAVLADSTVYAAIGLIMAQRGSVTTETLRAATGLSTGSLYHRFGSREGMLAEAWLDALVAFHRLILPLLEKPATMPGEIAAATPRFCREQRPRALVLACANHRQFLGPETPQSIQSVIADMNARLGEVLGAYAKVNGHPLALCRMALMSVPLGAVRQFLPAHDVPDYVDEAVARAAMAILASPQ